LTPTFELHSIREIMIIHFEKQQIYPITENARNLGLRYILCMQDFFDAIPQEGWKTKGQYFIRQSEELRSINMENG
jgi:hypothetical protein